MPLSTIILAVVVVCVALLVLNLLFESFKIILNILVIVGLVVWVLYATGGITNLPQINP